MIKAKDPLRIVVVGAIVPIKGFYVLRACARDARKRHLPLEFVVMGYTKNDAELAQLGVTITGRYNDAGAVEKLRTLDPDLVWLPSVWPETYSYTLSLALTAGVDIAAFDLGAIANRLRSVNRNGNLQPLAWVRRPYRINDYFVRFRSNRIQRQRSTVCVPERVVSIPRTCREIQSKDRCDVQKTATS